MELLTSPVELSGLTNDDWNTVSLSSWIPVGSTGALFTMSSPTGSSSAGWRKAGSFSATTAAPATGSFPTTFACGVNASRQVELYQTLGVQWWLIGYFGAEAVFFDEPVQHFPTAGNTWDTDTLTEAGSDTAVMAFLQFTGGTIGWRPTGDTNSYEGTLRGISGALCPLNGSKQFDFQTEDSSVSCNVFGYLKSGWTDSVSTVTPSSAVTWQDKTAPAADCIPMIIFITNSTNECGLRKNGASDGPLGNLPSSDQSSVIQSDASGIYEIYMADIATSSAKQFGYFTPLFLEASNLHAVERGKSVGRGLARGMR